MSVLKEITDEHSYLLNLLKNLEKCMRLEENIERGKVKKIMDELGYLWDKHEEKEEAVFSKLMRADNPFMYKKVLMEHRELRGHWKCLKQALREGNRRDIWITLDTDGRMIIEKFRKHISNEETLFENVENGRIIN